MAESKPSAPWIYRCLDFVERAGNRLPHPFWLFVLLLGLVCGLSNVLSAGGLVAQSPAAELLRDKQGEPGRQLGDQLVLSLSSIARSSRFRELRVEVKRGAKTILTAPVAPGELAHYDLGLHSIQFEQNDRVHVLKPERTIKPRPVISGEGLRWFLLHLIENFSHFEPLGIVLVMLMGVSVAEGSGLITAVMRYIALSVPPRMLTPTLFALAACGNIGSDAGVVVMPPLAAAIYRAIGKNPILGLIVGYVGATAGFTANLIPAGTDVLAMSLTNAATGGNPEISVLANWYFMIASVVFLATLGTLVTHRLIEPRLGRAEENLLEPKASDSLSDKEKTALRWAILALTLGTLVWLSGLLPGAPLRHPDPNPAMFWRSPFFKGLVPILFTLFVLSGTVYGTLVGTVKRPDDLLEFMAEAMRRMGPYIVLVLAISQFIAAFKYTQLDQMIAVLGAESLGNLGFSSAPAPFFVAFILCVALANLFIGSASAKWAIFAPIFVPMFMELGYHPAFTQLLYRVGDSITNCLSPLYPFFPLLLGWVAAEDETKAKVGTVIAYLLPYAVVLLGSWIVMTLLWFWLDLPVGPASPIRL